MDETTRPEISIHYQAAFDTDGEIEVTEESVATSLDDYGVDIDHREVDSRLDRPAASEFGVDDRAEVRRSSSDSDQASLFADTAADQQTLLGDDASAQFLFDESENQTDERAVNGSERS